MMAAVAAVVTVAVMLVAAVVWAYAPMGGK